MPDDEDVQLRVTIGNDEPIHGTIEDGAGTIIEFTGWLELISALDSACAQASDRGVQTNFQNRLAPGDHMSEPIDERPSGHF